MIRRMRLWWMLFQAKQSLHDCRRMLEKLRRAGL